MSSSASQRGVTGGRATASAVAGVIIAALLWYFGVDLGFACAVGVLAVAIGLAWAAYSGPSAVRWPLERPAPRPGARSDVTTLSGRRACQAFGASAAVFAAVAARVWPDTWELSTVKVLLTLTVTR